MSSYYFVGQGGGTTVIPGSLSVIGNITATGYVSAVTNVSARTADFTISTFPVGTLFTNFGAAGVITGTLPAATASGKSYTFAVRAVQFLQIQAGAGDAINLGGVSSSNQFRANTAGSSVTIVDIKANLWQATAIAGTWIVN